MWTRSTLPATSSRAVLARAVRLLRIGLNVADLGRAGDFYAGALGFAAAGAPREAAPEFATALGIPDARVTVQRLGLGAQEIEFAAFAPKGRPYPSASTSTDLWFQHMAIVVGDIAAAHARVVAYGGATPITEGGPCKLPASSGGVTAWKFRDPDGHPLELIAFPPQSGPEPWRHVPRDALAVGLDHSAISVADADRSTAFYETALGLARTSRQVNRGPAQARLDGVPDPVVDVVALTPSGIATPHLELLGYRSPRGRPVPPGANAADIAASRLVFGTDDLSGDDCRLGHDPDGHVLLFVSA
jgi:catechol 2,3-dioxygenase-like lactoylglutathione lyase family enzyme